MAICKLYAPSVGLVAMIVGKPGCWEPLNVMAASSKLLERASIRLEGNGEELDTAENICVRLVIESRSIVLTQYLHSYNMGTLQSFNNLHVLQSCGSIVFQVTETNIKLNMNRTPKYLLNV